MRQDLFDLHQRTGDSDGDGTVSFKIDVVDGLITMEDPVTPLSDTFTVMLNSQPSANVTIGTIQSLDPGEVTVSPSSLTFTPSNWNSPQTVTVTGVDDGLADNVQIVMIDLGVATGAEYEGVDPGDVTVQNLDDETAVSPAVIVLTGDGLITSEGGLTDAFQMVLNNPPAADVTIGPIVSSDTGEVTVFPSSLTFTTGNWNSPQTVDLNGVDELSYDGMQAISINLGSTSSTDGNWDAIGLGSVTVYNLDDDAPKGITVLAGSSLLTSETGNFSQFEVVLDAEPTATVTIPVSSSDVLEGTVTSPASGSLSFTTANWNVPQSVTVTGVDDGLADGNRAYSVTIGAATSSDGDYNGMNPPDVSFLNIDDDTPGIIVSAGSSMLVSESGTTSSFEVVLSSQPTASVDIPVSSSDGGEGAVTSPVAGTLTFTTANWSSPQTVVVQGVDDAAVDGDQAFTIVIGSASSADGSYNGMNPADISFTNVDDDNPAVKSIVVQAGSSTLVSETGSSSTFEIVLSAAPTANVDIGVSSSNSLEGVISVPAGGTVTFTTANWNSPKPVTVAGVDDFLADGNQPFTVILDPAVSTDLGYSGQDPADLSFECVDDDAPGITVSAGSSMLVSESGTSSSFEVVLNSEPTADVDIPVSSSVPAEGTIAVPASGTLTFTTGNWNIPQTVTVQGADDVIVDGDQPFNAVLDLSISLDGTYNGIDPGDVSFMNIDDDNPGSKSIVVQAGSSTLVSESGSSSSFEIVLSEAPTADVDIPVSSSDTGEGVISVPASGTLTFTTANWNVPKAVTVTGVDDFTADGNVGFTVVIGAATSTDLGYDGQNPGDLSFECVDDDAPGITVSAGSAMLVSESGSSSSFEVVLNSEPAASVDIDAWSDDGSEGAVTVPASGTLTFTSANWNIPQTVTVQGQDDFLFDGNQVFTLVLDPAASGDPLYNGVDPTDVSYTNVDDDTPGITVDWVDGLVTDETGLSDDFSIVLNSQPTADVTISTIQSTNAAEVTVSIASITFTSLNWNAPRIVTASGVDDLILDGLRSVTVDLGTASSTDTNYDLMDPGDVVVHNIDDESIPQVIVVNEPGGFFTSENGASKDIEIFLSQPPTANVDIPVASSDMNEGTLSTGMLTFTPVDWNNPQVVTVYGVDDAGLTFTDDLYTVFLDPVVSGDPNWGGIDPPDVPVTNLDFVTIPGIVRTVSSDSFNSISGTGTPITFFDTDLYDTYAEYDEGYFYLPIGFTFYYLGMPYDEITVYTDGMASFNPHHYTANVFANSLLFDNTATGDIFDNVLAPWWDDLTLDLPASNVYYEVLGTAPARTLVIEWVDARVVGEDEYYNFQIKLHEGSNDFEFYYGFMDDPSNPAGTTASVGIKDDTIGDNHFMDGLDGKMTLSPPPNDSRNVGDFPPIGDKIKFVP